MKKFISLLMVILLVGFVIVAGSPYYVAKQLKQSYDNSDGEAVVSHINFERLQPSIESQLNNKFVDTLSKYPMVQKLGGAPLTQTADAFITQSVQGAVTPKNISSLINTQGQANQATKELAAAWAIASNKVDLQQLIQDMIAKRGDIDAVVKNQVNIIIEQQAKVMAAEAQNADSSDQPQLAYCGIRCFTISGKIKGYMVTVEMQRVGLVGWEIVNIVLP